MLTLRDEQRRGTLLGVSAYLIWGFAALYWIQTYPVHSFDVLAHRAFWSLPFVLLCLALVGGALCRIAPHALTPRSAKDEQL